MRKVSALVIYDSKNNQIYNLSVNTNNTSIPLIFKPNRTEHNTFNDLYKTVLDWLKNNGFYTVKYNQFGRTFYNIQWIDINYPAFIHTYGYKGGENN